MNSADQAAIRRTIRRLRNEISPPERAKRLARITSHIIDSPEFRRSRRIGCYLAVGGEVDLVDVIDVILRTRKSCFLPVLPRASARRLNFAAFTSETILAPNYFGILEPKVRPSRQRSGHRLDLVLVPLVAFDSSGTRIGMGGGYYDTSFDFRLWRRAWRKPILAGVAFALQRTSTLIPRQSWDVPLDLVFTEDGVERFS